MDQKKLQELESGQEVTLITKGDYQLVDVALGIRIPPLTEVTMPLTPFVMDHLVLGNLTLVGEDDAPKAAEGSKPLNGLDALKYEGSRETEASRSKPTEDAFGGMDPEQAEPRNADEADANKDEIPQGARSGVEGTSRNKRGAAKSE